MRSSEQSGTIKITLSLAISDSMSLIAQESPHIYKVGIYWLYLADGDMEAW